MGVLTWARTCVQVLKNNYLMIGIDGSMAENGSDWFCYHATSPCIFPVGFCKINGLDLTPPRGLFTFIFVHIFVIAEILLMVMWISENYITGILSFDGTIVSIFIHIFTFECQKLSRHGFCLSCIFVYFRSQGSI